MEGSAFQSTLEISSAFSPQVLLSSHCRLLLPLLLLLPGQTSGQREREKDREKGNNKEGGMIEGFLEKEREGGGVEEDGHDGEQGGMK